MNLNNLFVEAGYDPREVIVFRHRPSEPKLRKVLPWLAAEKPEFFNAYQQTHGAKVENALLKARYVAAFIGHAPGKAVFVGLYRIGSTKPLTQDQYWRISAYKEMRDSYDMANFGPRSSVLWFDMYIEPFYSEWKGKMIVRWPGPEISWWRRAHNNDIQIEAVLEQSALTANMPAWSELLVSYSEIQAMPASWKTALSHWRGIYYIFDCSDGKGYVGAAYGSENILGRWDLHMRQRGDAVLLKRRDPNNFTFSILERVSPDMPAEAVIALEGSWKRRLHSRTPHGLNHN